MENDLYKKWKIYFQFRKFQYCLLSIVALTYGAQVYSATTCAESDVVEAIDRNNIDFFEQLIDNYANDNITDCLNSRHLIRAIFKKSGVVVNKLLTINMNINKVAHYNSYSETALYAAIVMGEVKVAENLLSQSANPNLSRQNGWTPLLKAVQDGNIKLVEMLLDNNANINQVNDAGSSALYLAVNRGFIDIVTLLIDRGADLNQSKYLEFEYNQHKDRVDNSPLSRKLRSIDSFKYYGGTSPIYIAIHRKHTEIVKVLANAGASLVTNRADGYDLFYLLYKNRDIELAKYLISKGLLEQNKISRNLSGKLLKAIEQQNKKLLNVFYKNPINMPVGEIEQLENSFDFQDIAGVTDEKLMELVESSDKAIRHYAIGMVSQRPINKRLKTALIYALQDKNQEIVNFAAATIFKIGQPMIDDLIAIMKDEKMEGTKIGISVASILTMYGTDVVNDLLKIDNRYSMYTINKMQPDVIPFLIKEVMAFSVLSSPAAAALINVPSIMSVLDENSGALTGRPAFLQNAHILFENLPKLIQSKSSPLQGLGVRTLRSSNYKFVENITLTSSIIDALSTQLSKDIPASTKVEMLLSLNDILSEIRNKSLSISIDAKTIDTLVSLLDEFEYVKCNRDGALRGTSGSPMLSDGSILVRSDVKDFVQRSNGVCSYAGPQTIVDAVAGVFNVIIQSPNISITQLPSSISEHIKGGDVLLGKPSNISNISVLFAAKLAHISPIAKLFLLNWLKSDISLDEFPIRYMDGKFAVALLGGSYEDVGGDKKRIMAYYCLYQIDNCVDSIEGLNILYNAYSESQNDGSSKEGSEFSKFKSKIMAGLYSQPVKSIIQFDSNLNQKHEYKLVRLLDDKQLKSYHYAPVLECIMNTEIDSKQYNFCMRRLLQLAVYFPKQYYVFFEETLRVMSRKDDVEKILGIVHALSYHTSKEGVVHRQKLAGGNEWIEKEYSKEELDSLYLNVILIAFNRLENISVTDYFVGVSSEAAVTRTFGSEFIEKRIATGLDAGLFPHIKRTIRKIDLLPISLKSKQNYLYSALRHKEPKIQTAALSKLVGDHALFSGSMDDIDTLFGLSKSNDLEVKRLATILLASNAQVKLLPDVMRLQLIEQSLGHENRDIHLQALILMAVNPDKKSVNTLQEELLMNSDSTRDTVIRALKNSNKLDVKTIVNFIESDSTFEQYNHSLLSNLCSGWNNDDALTSILIPLLSSANVKLRRQSLECLQEFVHLEKGIVKAIALRLMDVNRENREKAAKLIIKHGIEVENVMLLSAVLYSSYVDRFISDINSDFVLEFYGPEEIPTAGGVGALPTFPEIIPKWSSSDELKTHLLGKKDTTLRQAYNKLNTVLGKVGYEQSKLFQLPKSIGEGIAVVTRQERIDEDGHPFAGNKRWSENRLPLESFSLETYLKRLFFADPGYYRFMVFIIGNTPDLPEKSANQKNEDTRQSFANGINYFPKDHPLGEISISGMNFKVLIYHMRKTIGNAVVLYDDRSNRASAYTNVAAFSTRQHLESSGLWESMNASLKN